MISFSVDSDHPVSIHMRFSMNTYKGEGTSCGKLNVIASLIWFLFSNSDFPSRICCHFFSTTLFWQKLLIHTFSGQLFLQNSCCFLLFQNSHFFAGAIFSEQLLFRSDNSTEQSLLKNRKFFTAVTFRNSYIFSEELFRIKISKKGLLLQSRYFCTSSTFPENLHFGKN